MKEYEAYALKLTILCVIVFIMQSIKPVFFLNNFALISEQVVQKPWTIITHIFLHGSVQHLFYNMFALAIFGLILEKEVGSKKFIVIFFASGIFSALGDLLFYEASVGASGAIFGLLGCLGILKPRMIVWVMGLPVYMIIAVVLWALIDLTGMFAIDNVAHAAHLFGMFFGVLVGLRIARPWERIRNGGERREALSDEELAEWDREYMLEKPWK